MPKPQWWKSLSGYEHTEEQPNPVRDSEAPQRVESLAGRFIAKPKSIEAVKWDGSPDGAAEVKALLDKAGLIMDKFSVVYDSDGSPDVSESKIYYYALTRDGRKPLPSDYGYKEYALSDGWIVWEGSPYALPKTVSNEDFKKQYMELGSVDYDTFLEWTESAT